MEKSIPQGQEVFYQKLTAIVGPENVLTDNQATAPYAVDGLTPGTIVFAATTEQVSQIIRTANEFRTPIIPWGSGSKQPIGPCLSAADTILCLKNMHQIAELDASNFTVQVQAGMVNGELQRQLVEHKLFFPLDPLYLETSTIGGEIATNATGPLRFMYGSVRDLVLGVTVVTPTGDIIHTGGKTMKNVAGIDLCKLYIGSWGTLGIITEAVLRLFPLPEVGKTLCLTFANHEDAFRLVTQILHSVLTPSSIELIDWIAGGSLEDVHRSRLAEGEVLLMVNIEGDSEAVARHEKEISTLAKANKVRHLNTLEGEKATHTWKAYRRVHQSLLSAEPTTIQGKASVPIGKLGNMFHAVKEIGSRYDVAIGIRAHGGNGILFPYVTAKDDDAVRIINDLRQAAIDLGGYFMVETAPLRVRKSVAVLPQRNDYTLMKQLKTEFDPNNILNPGRVVGGLY
ncbi:MAG: FAD-binding oxidoreductase [Dehalococcoidales bacterium]